MVNDIVTNMNSQLYKDNYPLYSTLFSTGRGEFDRVTDFETDTISQAIDLASGYGTTVIKGDTVLEHIKEVHEYVDDTKCCLPELLFLSTKMKLNVAILIRN